MKNILFLSLIAFFSLIFSNSLILGAGSSDDENSDYDKVVDADYMNGKEQAYLGNYEAAIVHLKQSIENESKENRVA